MVWQRAVPAALQGRVFAVRRMLAVALIPLALLLSGWLVNSLTTALQGSGTGLHAAKLQAFEGMLVVFGLLSAAVSLWFALSLRFRHLEAVLEATGERRAPKT